MAKNPAHLDNFVSAITSSFKGFRIVGIYTNPKGEPSTITYATGKTLEQVKENFYMRYMLRSMDREMMLKDQQYGKLVIQYIKDNHVSFVEANPLLIV